MSNQVGIGLSENLKQVILLKERLRNIGLDNYIQLPRVVMFGMCSAGKSTLIEQILGLEFLPKGQSTRRPLELRLSYAQAIQYHQPTAEFVEEIKGIKFTNFDEVRKKIEELTDKGCGTSENIIDKQIILEIQGPNCPDLTLVDLPGIRRVPIIGQPNNIEEITTNMAKRFCEDKSVIILFVVAANQIDQKIFSLAKKFDPNGELGHLVFLQKQIYWNNEGMSGKFTVVFSHFNMAKWLQNQTLIKIQIKNLKQILMKN